MNRQSVDCRRVKAGEITQVGDFTFDEELTTIYLWMPGMSGPDAISIQRGNAPHTPRVWGWDGNVEKPTLSPSLLVPGVWHGYLRAGRLVSC